ncbi:MAG: WS/DGAT domain-containing protein [Acidimicrobiia bacterium]|nr:WS/DGAT domain-containing protein [Acidimicrobiia bacterium]
MTGPVRMSPEDSAFWKMESEVSRMHSVTLATFAGPAPSHDELRSHVAGCVPLVPRFRQRVQEVPFDAGRPMWIDDPDFDLDDHLIGASASVGMASLSELVSLIVSRQLDRSRPLWQLTVVDGLPDDEWAMVSKVHHSMIDGLFGTEPLAVLIDGAVGRSAPAVRWSPGPPPTATELLGQSIAELAFNPAEQYRFLRASTKRTRRRWDRLTGRSRAPVTDPTGLRGPVGAARAWTSVVVEMEALRTARRRFGASTHELVLALVTSGIRELLLARDESGREWPTVQAIVPMAVAGGAAAFHGGVEATMIELPVAEPDLTDRIDRLHREVHMATSKGAAIDDQIGVAGFAAPALASLGLREATRRGVTDRKAHTTIVNVPGPRHELSVLGRPMTEIHPVMPLAAGVRLSIGVLSYLDHLTFGVTTDRDSVPDGHVVTSGIRHALDELSNQELETEHASG